MPEIKHIDGKREWKIIDLVGQTFGMLKVLSVVGGRDKWGEYSGVVYAY